MLGRAFTYPIAALIVPVTWWLLSRSRRREYPYTIDILLVLPFLVDVAGNATNLYDTISWWDVNHFGDLALGLSGSVLAAALIVTVLWPTREGTPAPAPAGSRAMH